ncbi:MAG: hypothetical protein ACP5UD_08980 [Conexivisphaera sp.]
MSSPLVRLALPAVSLKKLSSSTAAALNVDLWRSMPTNMCLLSPDSHSPISLALFPLIPPTYDQYPEG